MQGDVELLKRGLHRDDRVKGHPPSGEDRHELRNMGGAHYLDHTSPASRYLETVSAAISRSQCCQKLVGLVLVGGEPGTRHAA